MRAARALRAVLVSNTRVFWRGDIHHRRRSCTMKNYGFIQRLSEAFPFERRTTASWLVPATLGVGFGICCGVGIGLLYAPRSGAETRQRLREGAERAKEKARVAAD